MMMLKLIKKEIFIILCSKTSCADPESFVRGGPTLIFLVDEQIPLKAGHHLPASETLCDFKVILTSIAKKPYIFVIFQGGPDLVPPPPLDPPMNICLP